MNKISLDKGYEIWKTMVDEMVNPVMTRKEYGYVLTDGHYTIEAEIFGNIILHEETIFGDIAFEVAYWESAERWKTNEIFCLMYEYELA